MHITGSLVNAYFICKRKFWLYARQFNPDPENDLLVLGRIISESAYKRQKKELSFDGVRIDLVRKLDKNIVVCEIKKTSKGLDAARMQLGFYLLNLREKGINVKGEILIPKEKRIIAFELDEKTEKLLNEAIENMQEIAKQDTPPPVNKTSFCRKCAFFEFCFA
ncbi:MAG: CRISPR-associated protein Cas4 [Candidatus Saccharicenans sp.]